MGYFPAMKFASGFEILECCQSMAETSGFYDHCLLHATVQRTTWNEADSCWMVATDRGNSIRARYVVLANGILTTPKLARIQGMETFEDKAFHTSRSDYNVDLEGKRVGIIGTIATAVQVIPEIAKVVKELFVFQRTPSTIYVRDQRATTQEEIETWSRQPGWARARRERLARISSGRTALKGNDDYLSGKVDDFREHRQYERELSEEELIQKQLNTNFRIMKRICARIDAIVMNPKTAAALKPYYPYGCKRPTFHDEFLPTFNRPNVTLVDTAPFGVGKINARGLVHDGMEYPLDVLIYSTGFQWMATSTFNMITGRGSQTLREKWELEGVKTFLGLHSHGLPNLLIMSGPQGDDGQFNFTRGIEAHTDYVVWMLKTLRARGANIVDIRKKPEIAYSEHCREADIRTCPLRDCLSDYNGDGSAGASSLAYYGGPQKRNELRVTAQAALEPYVFEPAAAQHELG